MPCPFASQVALLGGLHFMVLRGMLLCALFPMFALPCVPVCACVRVCVRVCDRRSCNTFSSSSRIDVVVSVWHHGTDHCESELRRRMHNLVSNFLSTTALFNARRNVWKHNPALGLGSCVTLSAHRLSCELLCVHGNATHVSACVFFDDWFMSYLFRTLSAIGLWRRTVLRCPSCR